MRWCGEGELAELWRDAGLRDVRSGPLVVRAGYADFEDLWSPLPTGVAPSGAFCSRSTTTSRRAPRRLPPPSGGRRGAVRADGARLGGGRNRPQPRTASDRGLGEVRLGERVERLRESLLLGRKKRSLRGDGVADALTRLLGEPPDPRPRRLPTSSPPRLTKRPATSTCCDVRRVRLRRPRSRPGRPSAPCSARRPPTTITSACLPGVSEPIRSSSPSAWRRSRSPSASASRTPRSKRVRHRSRALTRRRCRMRARTGGRSASG